MKTQTTRWESSSRPLFIRSVWLTSSEEDGGHLKRHFLLNYESEEEKKRRRFEQQQQGQQQDLQNHMRMYQQNKERHPRAAYAGHFKDGAQYSFDETLDPMSPNDPLNQSEENLLLIDSAKIQLNQTQQHNNRQQPKYQKFYRRPSIRRKKYETRKHDGEIDAINGQGLQDSLYSRCSSMHDLHSQFSTASQAINPEERLAERVLNWLDLAGKSGELLRNYNLNLNELMPTALQQQQKLEEQTDEKRGISRRSSIQDSRNLKNERQRRHSQQHLQMQTQNYRNLANHSKNIENSSNSTRRPTDAIKPITIIFNREGLPIRFNRPPRNIDLLALSSSASTTRRFAGVLASARLYQDNPMAFNLSAQAHRSTTREPSNATDFSSSMNNRTLSKEQKLLSPIRNVTRATVGGNNKRLHEDVTHIVNQCKRQLHIFMPSLSKKNLLETSSGGFGTADDASLSVLSHTFADVCKL